MSTHLKDFGQTKNNVINHYQSTPRLVSVKPKLSNLTRGFTFEKEKSRKRRLSNEGG